MQRFWRFLFGLTGLAIIFGLAIIVYWLLKAIWHQFAALSPEIAVAIITGASTIFVSTFTVVLGRYYERKKELDRLYRDKKVEIYDEFLKQFFQVFHNSATNQPHKTPNTNLSEYFKEWQRKLLLWAGPEVVEVYAQWRIDVQQRPIRAKQFLDTDKLLLAIRKDLGHDNRPIRPGLFVRIILNEANLLLAAVKQNPNITMDELSLMQKKTEKTKESEQKN